MFCQTCPSRDRCTMLCPELERHLRSLEGYQRELPLSSYKLCKVADMSGLTLADLQPENRWMWEDISEHVFKIPPRYMTPFLLHFYQEMTVAEVAKALKMHRITVHRLLIKALILLKRELPERNKELNND